MSRSVRIVVSSRHFNPTTTRSLFLRILIVFVALTIELVDSSESDEPSLYHLPIARYDTRPISDWLIPEEEFNNDDEPTSSYSLPSDADRKNSGFNLRSKEIELTYKLSETVDRDKEVRNLGGFYPHYPLDGKPIDRNYEAPRPPSDSQLIQRALRGGVFLTPEELAERNYDSSSSNGFGGERIDDEKKMQMPIPKPECRHSTICNATDSYPTEYIKELVKNLDHLKALSGVDTLADPMNRIDDDSEDVSLCQSNVEIWKPEMIRKGVDDKDSWDLVVNVDTFEQGLRISVCANKNSKCQNLNNVGDPPSSSYESVCRQQYLERRVVVVDRNNPSNLTIGSYPIPTSCCCHVKPIFPFRFGGNTANIFSRQSQSPRLNNRGKRHHRDRARHN